MLRRYLRVRLLRERVVGHYLNLPVVEADGRLVAIVDVLKLTYATLEQVRVVNQLLIRRCLVKLVSDERYVR